VVQRAKKAAKEDVSVESNIRDFYSEISGELMNSIKQKLFLAKVPDSPFCVLSTQELASLAMSLEITQKVHHKALGIPELIKIDPTTGFEGIRIIPAHEDPALDDGKKK